MVILNPKNVTQILQIKQFEFIISNCSSVENISCFTLLMHLLQCPYHVPLCMPFLSD